MYPNVWFHLFCIFAKNIPVEFAFDKDLYLLYFLFLSEEEIHKMKKSFRSIFSAHVGEGP